MVVFTACGSMPISRTAPRYLSSMLKGSDDGFISVSTIPFTSFCHILSTKFNSRSILPKWFQDSLFGLKVLYIEKHSFSLLAKI